MTREPVIELEGLGVRFGGRPVLSDLRAAVRGRAIGLLGPNGAGKTTLIHTLLGFHEFEGAARVLGCDVRSDVRQLRAQVGYMPEVDAYVGDMSAVRFVRLMAELSGLPRAAALERAHETLFYVGLGEARYRPLATYSQGMRQMVKLAQAIAHGPRLLFLDEPTNGLDPRARRRMLDLVGEIRDTGEVTIVLSSHLLKDVEECCDAVVILKSGRIAAQADLAAERQEHKRFFDLHVLGASDAFMGAAEALGCACAVGTNGRIKLVAPEGIEVRELYRVAADQGAEIRSFSHRRDSLEDIFFQAMEGENGGL